MIDLHCHSYFSDGTDAPANLVRMGDDLGLKALALTDHDTLDGLPEFLACQPQTRTRLIPGIELSCRYLGMELHLLGLFLDLSRPSLHDRIQELKQRRVDRNTQMLARLQSLGLRIEWEDVTVYAGSDLVSRAHFARALHRLGHAGSPQDAFQRLLGEHCPGYVPFQDLGPAEACAWVREAGGVTVVAHPGRSVGRNFRWEEAMADLKGMGVSGLESYYADYSSREERYFLALARDLGMARSGGSDYHGGTKPGIRLGVGRGSLAVPDTVLEELEARRSR